MQHDRHVSAVQVVELQGVGAHAQHDTRACSQLATATSSTAERAQRVVLPTHAHTVRRKRYRRASTAASVRNLALERIVQATVGHVDNLLQIYSDIIHAETQNLIITRSSGGRISRRA